MNHVIQAPTDDELFGAKVLIWALETPLEDSKIDPADMAVLEFLRWLSADAREMIMTQQPHYLWAFEILEHHGLLDLRAQVKFYDEAKD